MPNYAIVEIPTIRIFVLCDFVVFGGKQSARDQNNPQTLFRIRTGTELSAELLGNPQRRWGIRTGIGKSARDLFIDVLAEDVLKDRRMEHQHGAVAEHEQQEQALRHVEPTSGEQRNVHRVNRN